MKKLTALFFTVLFFACSHPSSEYLGKWKNDDGTREVEISQNGDNLLVKLTEPSYMAFLGKPSPPNTTTFAGTIKDGVLKMDGAFGAIALTHVKSDDTLLLATMGGNIVFKREK